MANIETKHNYKTNKQPIIFGSVMLALAMMVAGITTLFAANIGNTSIILSAIVIAALSFSGTLSFSRVPNNSISTIKLIGMAIGMLGISIGIAIVAIAI